jgi:signal peptidase I
MERILEMSWPRRAVVALVLASLLGLLALPVLMGTQTYPLAIVEGTSMYPSLQNGDLVVFQGASQHFLPNGTVIVFVEGGTGFSSIDSMIRPVVVHRIVGVVVQSDGTANYRTKGDNNALADPGLVPSADIMGIPAVVLPKAGLVVLFAKSPQGLVAAVGLLSLFYLGGFEAKAKEEDKRKALLGALAQMALNNEIPEDLFRKYELAVKYVDGLNLEEPMDGRTLALVDWIKKGALDREWKAKKLPCPDCYAPSTIFESSNGLMFVACPSCARKSA